MHGATQYHKRCSLSAKQILIISTVRTSWEGPQRAAKGRPRLDVVPERGHVQTVLIDDAARTVRHADHCAVQRM